MCVYQMVTQIEVQTEYCKETFDYSSGYDVTTSDVSIVYKLGSPLRYLL